MKKYYNDKEYGRVYYVEPNTVSSIERVSESQTENYELINPMEDYSIYVNLEVEVRGRTVRVNGGSEMKTYSMSWQNSGSATTVNFMGGSKIPVGSRGSGEYMNSLTTNYTDIFISDINKKTNDRYVSDPTTEMFGISSIDISYRNYVVPEVTIEFVDVRGVSLFAQEEAAHNSEGYADTTVEGSFFKSFFTFPYPKFTLYVKGFYGEPVSYELTCSDFRARFDSNTGNFGATAKFLGYAFSFLSDISLASVIAAPYSDFLGSEYWDTNVANGEFSVIDVNGQKAPMMRFGDLMTKINQITQKAEELSKNSPAVQQKEYDENRRNRLNLIAGLYTSYSNQVKAAATKFGKLANICDSVVSVTDMNSASDIRGVVFMGFVDTFNGKKFADVVSDIGGTIHREYENLKNEVKNYNTSYNASLPLPLDMGSSGLTPDRIFSTKGNSLDFSSSFNEKLTKYDATSLRNALVRFRDSETVKKMVNGAIDGLDGFVFIDHGFGQESFLDELSKERQKVSDNLANSERGIEDAVDEAVTDALKFPPTVENFTRMLMAHFETLAYCIYRTSTIISSDNTKRTLSNLGLNLGDASDVNGTETIVPPFPRVTHEVTEFGETKREDSWVGDYSGDFREKDLVHGLLNGVSEFSRLSENAKQGTVGSEPSSNTKATMAVPVAPSDFVATKGIYVDMGGFENNDELAAQLAMRAFLLMGFNNLTSLDPDDLGKFEAMNFAAKYPTPTGTLTAITGDTNIVQTLYDTLTKGGSHKWGDKSFIESDGNRIKLRFNTIKGKMTAIPYQQLASTRGAQMRNGMDSAVFKSGSEYITSDYQNNQTSENTFVFDKNIKRVNDIIQNQLSDGDSSKLKGLYEDALFSSERINKLFYNTKRINGMFSDESKHFESTEGSLLFPINASVGGNQLAFKDNQQNFESFIDGKINGNERISDAFKEKYLVDLSTSEVSITEFYGVKDGGNGKYVYDKDKCLFGQRCYYSTDDLHEKAYMFLTSLDGFFGYSRLINYGLFSKDKSKISIYPYAVILKVGADCWKSPNTAYPTIRKDVKDKFMREFTTWVDSIYRKIDAQLAVFVNEEQFDALINGGGFFDLENRKCVIERFTENTKNPEAFFTNYMSVTKDNADFGLLNRPSGVGIKDATAEILQMCTVIKMTDRIYNGEGAVSLSGDDLKEFFEGFVDKMKELYSSTTETQNTSNQINQAKEPEQNEKNIKIGVYKYCKLLYDKWLAGLSQEKFNSSYTMKKFFDGFDADGFGKMFHFVDSFYSLANDIFINIGSALEKMATAMDGNDDYSMISYFTDVLAENHLMLYCIQNFMDLSDKESLQNMFKPVPVISMRRPHDTPNFVIMYAGEPSSNLDMGANNEYKNDSYLLSVDDGKGGNEWPKALLSSRVGSMGGYTLPAFGVSYGKMYQSYFQDIDVGMDNPIVTEQSIKAQFNIASKNNEGEQSSNRDGHTLGQDLFTVYSNNSYTCTVKMMGCAWVQPLMYFCLNNVPMFRGTYLVTKVRHNIEPGNMTTTFEGVRMSNVRTRRVDSWLYRRKAMNNGVVNENQEITIENLAADITNDCPYKAYPILSEGAGGNYGEPNLLGKVMGTVGQAPGNQLKGDWANRNLKDSLCAMIRQEAGGDEQGWKFMTALVYNRLRARGNWSTILSRQFSSWFDGGADKYYKNQQDKDKIGPIIDNIFANGSAGILAGTVYTIDSEWRLDRNGNNTYKLKNGSNTLTAEQAAKLYFNGFLKEWNNEYNGADNYIRHKDCTLLCVIGGQAFCEDPSAARRLKVEAAPKALNDNTNKISPFAMGFYNAVQQTSHNSAIGVDFGVSNDKSKGLNLYISNGKKADKFAAVFDVIMNTPEYFSHVKKLMWITDQNSVAKAPVGFMVELTEQNYEENRQIGFSFNDGESLTDSKLTYTKESLNDAFVKGVIKHYANANDAALEIGCISNLPDMFKTKGDIAECSSIVQSSTPTGDLRGFAGTVTNERMKKVLSKVDYLCHGHQNKGQWYVVRGSNGTGFEQVKSGAGWCTFGPSTWYNEAGLDLHFWSNKINGRDVYLGPGGATFASSSGQIHSYGFECVYHSDATNESKKYLNDRTHLRPGDLAIMFVGNPNSAHACMWTGNDWRSDFKQNNCWIYGGKPGRGEDGFHISLWRHPEFQEPGLPIT